MLINKKTVLENKGVYTISDSKDKIFEELPIQYGYFDGMILADKREWKLGDK